MLHSQIFSQKGFATRTLLLASGGALVVVAILGLGAYLLLNMLGGSVGSSKPVTLTYWGLWEPSAVMQPLIDKYHQLHPNVTIHYEQRPMANHYATVQSRIKSSSTDAPDIVEVHSSWVPVLRNMLSPLPGSVMPSSTYATTYLPVTKDLLLNDNRYYGIPLEVDGLSLVYNQDLFSAAGITTPPVTWDDVRSDAAKIAKRDSSGKLLVGGIAMGSANNVDNFADILGLLMAQNGVVFADDKGNVTFQKSITQDGRNLGAEAISFYTLFTTTEKSWDDSMDPSTLAFGEGKVGMILVPSWRLLSVVSQHPSFGVQVAEVPHLTTDQKVGYANYWTEVVPKASKNQTEAWKFLAWLSSKDQEISLASTEEQLRPFAAPYSRQDLLETMASDQYLAPYGSQASTYKSSLFANDTGATMLNDTINQGLAQVIRSAESAGNTRDGASAAGLNSLADSVTKLLEQQRNP